jgi:hypothetical protein
VQALAAADAADIYVVFDDENHIMAILPKNSSRGGVVPIISPDTGLVGYPSYVGPGMIGLKTIYNPSIRFMANVNVQSSLTPANGLWRVTKLVHELESRTIDGKWFTQIEANKLLATT